MSQLPGGPYPLEGFTKPPGPIRPFSIVHGSEATITVQMQINTPDLGRVYLTVGQNLLAEPEVQFVSIESKQFGGIDWSTQTDASEPPRWVREAQRCANSAILVAALMSNDTRIELIARLGLYDDPA